MNNDTPHPEQPTEARISAIRSDDKVFWSSQSGEMRQAIHDLLAALDASRRECERLASDVQSKRNAININYQCIKAAAAERDAARAECAEALRLAGNRKEAVRVISEINEQVRARATKAEAERDAARAALKMLVEAKDLIDRIERECISKTMAPPTPVEKHPETPRYRDLKTRGWAMAREALAASRKEGVG